MPKPERFAIKPGCASSSALGQPVVARRSPQRLPMPVRDHVERCQEIEVRLFPAMQGRLDWSGSVLRAVEGARRARLLADKLVARRRSRDRRLMGLLHDTRRARTEIGVWLENRW